MTTLRTASSTTPGVNVTLADGDGLFVAQGVLVASSGSTGVNALFDHHSIQVAGAVFGPSNGIVLGTIAAKSNGIDSDIWIGDAGSVSGEVNGIATYGAGITVTNEGSIFSAATGLAHLGNALMVTNIGTVSAGSTAIYVTGTGAVIENLGVITSQGFGIWAMEDTTLPANGNSAITVENHGTITGYNGAFKAIAVGEADVFTTTLRNHGIIDGVIYFADGDDLYDGHDGVASEVLGNIGNDTLIGGAARDVLQGEGGQDSLEGGGGNDLLVGGTEADALDGGDGDDVLRPGAGLDIVDGGGGARDVLDYLGSAAVVVNLGSGDASGGDAQGDIFVGFEWLAGGNAGDALTGDAGANGLLGRLGHDNLSGAGGNDVLVGDAGNDTLAGGAGVDILRGGAGADWFRFIAATDSGAPGQVRDRIGDFVQADADRIDISAIDADTGLAGVQDFAFIGTAAFTAAGQVRAQVIAGNTFVFGNTDATTGTTEFSFVLSGSVTLTATDFIL